MTQSCLSIRDLRITRQGQTVLTIPEFSIGVGEMVAVIGPNGAGKSSLLMAVASLLPYEGVITLNGTAITPVNAAQVRKQIALVMQDPPILNMSVFENVSIGLRFRGLPQREISQRVNHWLERLSISHLAKRPASRISGGEAQRVALARAFVIQPTLMLLDEPFSALDNPTRLGLIHDLHQILEDTQITTLFVTHDLDEALAISDRVAVLINGQLRQLGKASQVFSSPADREIAAFVGVETIIPGSVKQVEDGLMDIQTDAGIVQAIADGHPGQSVWICLRPEEITLFPKPDGHLSSARNHIPCTVLGIAAQGPLVRVLLGGAYPMTALITRASLMEMNLKDGSPVIAAFKASAVHIIIR